MHYRLLIRMHYLLLITKGPTHQYGKGVPTLLHSERSQLEDEKIQGKTLPPTQPPLRNSLLLRASLCLRQRVS